MASRNRRSRIERLEQQACGIASSSTLIVAMSRFAAPDDAFTGYTANGEFFAREPGETLDDTKRRITHLVSRRGDSTFYFLKPVLQWPHQYVAELPE